MEKICIRLVYKIYLVIKVIDFGVVVGVMYGI